MRKKYRFFRRLDGVSSSRYYQHPPLTMSIFENIEYGAMELLRRLAFTAIGAIMLWWSWLLLEPQISSFPDVDWLIVLVAVFTLVLGIRNAISIFKGLSWGQVFLTLLFVAINAWLIWFA